MFLQGQSNLLIALLATGLVAVLFHPLREWLQRRVNRMIFGERDDPIEALSRLGKSLEIALPNDQVLPVLVETIAQTLKLPFVGIALHGRETAPLAAQVGTAVENPLEFPLTFQGETTGYLLVGPRGGEESFNPVEERLLRNLAPQAGAAVRNAQLTADLQRSRQQLVTAREEERLRLRRDLHDGLGPALASVSWQAESARELVHADPSGVVQLLESIIEQAQSALTDIRRLVYGLRPPALDELGLVGALEQAIRQQQMDVIIEAPPALTTLPAAVEVAVYRIVQEALKNAMEHGRAENCVVNLALDGNLCLTIRDDGQGLPEVVTPGVGLVSMRERAEELGGTFAFRPRQAGGTEVAVSLPLESGG
jgi:signal transduction histidine kinase